MKREIGLEMGWKRQSDDRTDRERGSSLCRIRNISIQ